jgi:hypothetical protein
MMKEDRRRTEGRSVFDTNAVATHFVKKHGAGEIFLERQVTAASRFADIGPRGARQTALPN